MPRYPFMSAVASRPTIDCAAATAGGPANRLQLRGSSGSDLARLRWRRATGRSNATPQRTGKGLKGTPPVIGILTLAWPSMAPPIAFGTDDLGFSSPGDLALSALGTGGNPVGQAITVIHRNALIN